YRHQRASQPQNMNGPREPVRVGGWDNPQTRQGKIVTGLLGYGEANNIGEKLQALQISIMKVETVSTNGFGSTKSEGSKFLFSGPDAGKLEGMEMAHQSQVNTAFDQQFATFASDKLGADFNSLSPEEQAQFKVDNMNAATTIMMSVQAELGPSPKQQLITQQEELLKQGVVTPEVEVKELPMIRQGN